MAWEYLAICSSFSHHDIYMSQQRDGRTVYNFQYHLTSIRIATEEMLKMIS